jgi:hypothetical protein
MLQFMVAPEWDVVSGVGIDVPGLEKVSVGSIG